MNEQQFYQTLVRPKLQTWGWAYDRIENILSPGIPDVNYITNGGLDGWLELKVIHDNGKLYFEKFQLPWVIKRLNVSSSARIFLFAKMNKPMSAVYLTHASELIKAHKLMVPEGKWLVAKYSDIKWDVIATVKGDWRHILKRLEGPISIS